MWYNGSMIKQAVILLTVVFMLAALVNVVYASAYLPIATNGDVHSAAIGYGQAVVIDGNNWIDATCADGSLPLVQIDDSGVIVKCGE